jgi:hypothetical protein
VRKRQARNRREVECRDYLAVVVEKGQPAFRFALLGTTIWAFKVAGNRGLGNLEPELEQLTMDARRTPGGILRLHAPNELADLLMHY